MLLLKARIHSTDYLVRNIVLLGSHQHIIFGIIAQDDMIPSVSIEVLEESGQRVSQLDIQFLIFWEM